MVSRRQVLQGFLSIPAVIFANKALAHQRTASLVFPVGAGPRALWGQALIDGLPYGEPFLMEATPAAKGVSTMRNVGAINLPRAPRCGVLEVEVFSAEYGSLGRTKITTNVKTVATDDSVVITSVVMR